MTLGNVILKPVEKGLEIELEEYFPDCEVSIDEASTAIIKAKEGTIILKEFDKLILYSKKSKNGKKPK